MTTYQVEVSYAKGADGVNGPPAGTPAGRMALSNAGGGVNYDTDPNSVYARAPHAAGGPVLLARKIRGGNVTVKPGYPWAAIWSEWDWDNWIKPQVDRAVALGLNAVRMIGAPDVTQVAPTVVEGLDVISADVYNARWAQLAAYCQQQGLYLYPALVEASDWIRAQGTNEPDYQDATLSAVITGSAAVLADYRNVIAFDLFQEGDVLYASAAWAASTAYATGAFVKATTGRVYKATTGGTSASSGGPTGTGSGITDGTVTWAYQRTPATPTDVLALMTAIRALCPLPLTCSDSSVNYGAATTFWTETTSLPALVGADDAGSDFVDLHVYLDGVTPSVLNLLPPSLIKPILIGEFGAGQDLTDDQATARFAGIASLHAVPGVIGSLVWALADQGTDDTAKYGVWDNTGFDQGSTALSVSTGQRTTLTGALRKFALSDRPQPYLPLNMLTAAVARPRSTTTGWNVGSNTTLQSGARGLALTATASGSIGAGTASGQLPVTAGSYYRMTVELLAGTTARTMYARVDFYDASGTYLSSVGKLSASDSTLTPTTYESVVKAPTNAANAVIAVASDTGQTCGAGEQHFVISAALALV